jgi:hypothetical protein
MVHSAKATLRSTTTKEAKWSTAEGTFTRSEFHRCFLEKVVPLLNPWPLPRSVVILDNAKIHMYPEIERAVHQCGARLLFLPPYCPQLNPIELCFGQLKKWIQRLANIVFPLYPKQVLEVVMRLCTAKTSPAAGFFRRCGYANDALRDQVFEELMASG